MAMTAKTEPIIVDNDGLQEIIVRDVGSDEAHSVTVDVFQFEHVCDEGIGDNPKNSDFCRLPAVLQEQYQIDVSVSTAYKLWYLIKGEARKLEKKLRELLGIKEDAGSRGSTASTPTDLPQDS